MISQYLNITYWATEYETNTKDLISSLYKINMAKKKFSVLKPCVPPGDPNDTNWHKTIFLYLVSGGHVTGRKCRSPLPVDL